MSFKTTYTKCTVCGRDENYVLMGTRGAAWIHICKYNCTDKVSG